MLTGIASNDVDLDAAAGFDSGERRWVALQLRLKVGNALDFPLNLDEDACRIVADEASQRQPAGERIDVRPKTHTLYDSCHSHPPPSNAHATVSSFWVIRASKRYSRGWLEVNGGPRGTRTPDTLGVSEVL